MQLKKIEICNFRLLHDIAMYLEERTTVIVGRNNSGKTSLTEVARRLLTESNPRFRLEDFSCVAHHCFWDAYKAHKDGKPLPEVRSLLPNIKASLRFEYSEAESSLGPLSDFIVDLDPQCTEALVIIEYTIEEGRISELFAGLEDSDEASRPAFFKTIRDRIPDLYSARIFAVDPNDELNADRKDATAFRKLCMAGFINAQRGLDDVSYKEHVVIGKVLENLFATAKKNSSDKESYDITQELEVAVQGIEDKISSDFNAKLDMLLPALSTFGYPGLKDPKLLTETTLDVDRLLSDHTKVKYTGSDGVHLPEAYNGLGARNLILILLLLRDFFKQYLALEVRPAVHLIFIEEPEVHLHPQMQEVFISKLGEIAAAFCKETSESWPVQFVVSTHSSHIANAARFEAIRYFMSTLDEESQEFKASVKDLDGLSGKPADDREFLHQYMTLTRCDLFFADKAILIEGTTERLLLPKIIQYVDANEPLERKLGSQYLSILEIGGAYAHLFFDLVEFLELKALIITDIDSVKSNPKGRFVACPVGQGTGTSNACIKSWFGKASTAPSDLTSASDGVKAVGSKRLAYQLPESDDGPCGRSFEDAFMLANPKLFPLLGKSRNELELEAWEAAKDVKKSEFALDHVLRFDDWTVPRYIREGLSWLAGGAVPATRLPKDSGSKDA